MSNELKKEVELKILQFIKGQAPEKNKFEIKREWYDLSWKTKPVQGQPPTINKQFFDFLKACTSIINSYGRDDGFIVIGIDQNTKECFDTDISQSKLDDVSKIRNIVIGNVDQAFLIDIDYLTVEGKQLSVIHIPPSTSKPHLIREYWSEKGCCSENVIFLRSGSGKQVATKGDIDRMYWERSNIILDRKIEVSLDPMTFGFHTVRDQKYITCSTNITLENLGTREILFRLILIKCTYREYSLVLNASSFYEEAFRSRDTFRLEQNKPIQIKITPTVFVLGEQTLEKNRLTDELLANRKDIKIESVTIRLTNYEEILSIPIVRKYQTLPN